MVVARLAVPLPVGVVMPGVTAVLLTEIPLLAVLVLPATLFTAQPLPLKPV